MWFLNYKMDLVRSKLLKGYRLFMKYPESSKRFEFSCCFQWWHWKRKLISIGFYSPKKSIKQMELPRIFYRENSYRPNSLTTTTNVWYWISLNKIVSGQFYSIFSWCSRLQGLSLKKNIENRQSIFLFKLGDILN